MNDCNINYKTTINYLTNLLNYLEKRYFNELTDEEKANNSYLYLTEKNILKSIINKKNAKEIEKVYYFVLEILNTVQFARLNEQSLTDLNELLNSILNIPDNDIEDDNILNLSLD